MYVCLCTLCVPGVWGEWKWALDLLELKLQTVVNLHVGAENWIWVL